MNAKWLKCQKAEKESASLWGERATNGLSLSLSLIAQFLCLLLACMLARFMANVWLHPIYSTTEVEIMMDDSIRSIFHGFEMNFWSPSFLIVIVASSSLPPFHLPGSSKMRMTTSFNYTYQLKRKLIRLHSTDLYCLVCMSIPHAHNTEHTKKEDTFSYLSVSREWIHRFRLATYYIETVCIDLFIEPKWLIRTEYAMCGKPPSICMPLIENN